MTDADGPVLPWAVRVVVPARDEAALLAGCLTSVRRAGALATSSGLARDVSVTVVLDRCTDESAAVLDRFPEVDRLVVDHGCVGAARADGVVHATRDDADPGRVWLAGTDADSLVPRDWLLSHLALAVEGWDVVVGTVEPDGAALSPAALAAWRSRHERRDGHGHVHGANLGLTLRAYRAAGGFPRAQAHEDVLLVERLRRAGVRWLATSSAPVLTSSRHVGRAPQGFADYLRGLDELSEPSA